MIPPATATAPATTKQLFAISQLDEVPAVKCPCGFSRRAFATPDNPVATIHLVDIQTDAQTHYHKKLTEIYLILETEGECFMELDGELYPVKPMTSILIKPGCRHRAVGQMKIVNIPVPAFDPHDEWFD
jgi:mannose-6-phosphate isomerase-like protein (cupin superfamily)